MSDLLTALTFVALAWVLVHGSRPPGVVVRPMAPRHPRPMNTRPPGWRG